MLLTHRQKSTFRWIGGAALAALALVLVPVLTTAVERSGASGEPRAGRALPVAVMAVGALEHLPVTRVFTGTLSARRRAALAFEVNGRIEEPLAEEGSLVRAGDVLGRVDTSRTGALLDAARSQRAAQEAGLEELVAGPRPQTIDAARARTSALSERLALARLQSERRSDLAASGAVSSEERDVAARSAAALAAELAGARAELEELEEGTRAEVVAKQSAVVRELDATIARLELDLADAVLHAPFEARVQHRFVDEGTFVKAGEPVLDLVEHGPLEARIGLPTRLLPEAALQERLTLWVDGLQIPARVKSVLPVLEASTRAATLLLEIEDAAARGLSPGRIASLEIQEPEVGAPRGYRIPLTALTRGVRGLWELFAAVPTAAGEYTVERREVELLGTDGDHVLVRGLVHEGDLVLTDGLQRVVPGQRVRILGAPPLTAQR